MHIDHSQNGDLTTTGGLTQSFTVTSTTGNLIVLMIATAQAGSSNNVTSVTDNKNAGNYSQVGTGSTGPICSQIFYYPAASTGVTSITIHYGFTTLTFGYQYYDLSGAASSSVLETSNTLSSQTATTNPVGPSVTTLLSDFVCSLCGPANSITTPFVAAPFSPVDFADSTQTGAGFAHVQTVPVSAGTYNPSWTQGTSGTWGGVTAAFKSGSAVPGWSEPAQWLSSTAGPSYAI